jgi:hypothetical protein
LAWGVWIGFDWLRMRTSGGLLWVRWWIFGLLRHGVSFCWKSRVGVLAAIMESLLVCARRAVLWRVRCIEGSALEGGCDTSVTFLDSDL